MLREKLKGILKKNSIYKYGGVLVSTGVVEVKVASRGSICSLNGGLKNKRKQR